METECKESSVAGGGEGVLAKQNIPADTLVALYNGLRQPPLPPGAHPADGDICAATALATMRVPRLTRAGGFWMFLHSSGPWQATRLLLLTR